AAMTMLFGLPVAGSMNYSPILATNARGPAWVTGGFQGPEGSAFAVLVSFALLFAVVKVTAELKHRYGYPEIVPGGIPVDVDAAARRQHEAAMEHSTAQESQLVQILPAQDIPSYTPPAPAIPTEPPASLSEETGEPPL